MYIEKYWGDYIGGTDDSLTLTDYLAMKGKKEISLEEIFADFGADTLFGDFRQTDPPLVFRNPEGWEMGLECAIDLVSDLAALLLECKVNGSVDLLELDETLELEGDDSIIRIAAAPKESEQINKILADFADSPAAYDISEFTSAADLRGLASVCWELREELFG